MPLLNSVGGYGERMRQDQKYDASGEPFHDPASLF
jgi:hypothetical protein